jgi:hypothetical protein
MNIALRVGGGRGGAVTCVLVFRGTLQSVAVYCSVTLQFILDTYVPVRLLLPTNRSDF